MDAGARYVATSGTRGLTAPDSGLERPGIRSPPDARLPDVALRLIGRRERPNREIGLSPTAGSAPKGCAAWLILLLRFSLFLSAIRPWQIRMPFPGTS